MDTHVDAAGSKLDVMNRSLPHMVLNTCITNLHIHVYQIHVSLIYIYMLYIYIYSIYKHL